MPDESIKTAPLTPERRLEKLLLSQGFPRSTWPALIEEMSDAVRGELVELVDERGIVQRGARRAFQAWRAERAKHIRDAAARDAAKESGPSEADSGGA